jgi:hypothetical protein
MAEDGEGGLAGQGLGGEGGGTVLGRSEAAAVKEQ